MSSTSSKEVITMSSTSPLPSTSPKMKSFKLPHETIQSILQLSESLGISQRMVVDKAVESLKEKVEKDKGLMIGVKESKKEWRQT